MSPIGRASKQTTLAAVSFNGRLHQASVALAEIKAGIDSMRGNLKLRGCICISNESCSSKSNVLKTYNIYSYNI